MANDNNNPFGLPKLTGEENTNQNMNPNIIAPSPTNEVLDEGPAPMPNMSNNNEGNKPIIEIPQKYYDILEEERKQKEQQEQEKQVAHQAAAEIKGDLGKLGTLVLLNAIVIFACLIGMVKIFEFLIFVIPAFIVVMSFVHATKEKDQSNYPLSILIGGMLVAVVTFVISMVNEENMDMWTHFAVVSAVSAFLGLIIANIITKLITRRNEVKALETLGYLLFFVALVAVPVFLNNKYPEAFHRILFQSITEVKAESEEEFVIKTLKNRYNLDFKCDEKAKSHQDFGNIIKKSRTCKAPDGKEVTVLSAAYNESKNQYIVYDNYTEVLFFKPLADKMAADIKKINEAKDVKIYFYPETGCFFVGDCADSDEYRENIEKEEDINNQYKTSSSLDLSKYMKNPNAIDFINDGKYKVIIKITISGTLDVGTSAEHFETVDKILDYLNSSGLKNNYGFDILVQKYDASFDYAQEELKVTGKATSDKTFKDQVVVKDANSKN